MKIEFLDLDDRVLFSWVNRHEWPKVNEQVLGPEGQRYRVRRVLHLDEDAIDIRLEEMLM